MLGLPNYDFEGVAGEVAELEAAARSPHDFDVGVPNAGRRVLDDSLEFHFDFLALYHRREHVRIHHREEVDLGTRRFGEGYRVIERRVCTLASVDRDQDSPEFDGRVLTHIGDFAWRRKKSDPSEGPEIPTRPNARKPPLGLVGLSARWTHHWSGRSASKQSLDTDRPLDADPSLTVETRLAVDAVEIRLDGRGGLLGIGVTVPEADL